MPFLTVKNAVAWYDPKTGHFLKTTSTKGKTRHVCSDHQFSTKVHATSCGLKATEEEPLPKEGCPGNLDTPHNHPPPKRFGVEINAFRWGGKVKLEDDPGLEVSEAVSDLYEEWEFDMPLEEARVLAFVSSSLHTFKTLVQKEQREREEALKRKDSEDDELEEDEPPERSECDRKAYDAFIGLLRAGTEHLGPPVPKGRS